MIVKYFWNILIGIDQLANTLIGGDPDETISSRCGKRNWKPCRWLCRVLHKLDPEHCEKSIEADEGSGEVIKL